MKTILQTGTVLFFAFAILAPIYIWYTTNGMILFNQPNLRLSDTLRLIFPLLGMLSFTLIWFQIMLGAFMTPLYKLFAPLDILKFHIFEGTAAIILVFLHPTLLFGAQFLDEGWNGFFSFSFVASDKVMYVFMGEVAFVLFFTAVSAAILRNKPFLVKHWRKFHMLQYVTFILVFLHSINLGSHTSSSPIKQLWLLYATTFLIALFYRRIYKQFIKPI